MVPQETVETVALLGAADLPGAVPRKSKADAGRVEQTACPRCGGVVPVRGDRGACPACGLPVRFVEAPERPCVKCGAPVALSPVQDAVRCAPCGTWQTVDAARVLVSRATCPRCGRDVEVPVDGDEAPCPRCGARMRLGPASSPGAVRGTL